MFPRRAKRFIAPPLFHTDCAGQGFLQEDQALPIFRDVFAREERWARLVPRLPASGLLPNDPKKVEKILSVAPAGSRPKP